MKELDISSNFVCMFSACIINAEVASYEAFQADYSFSNN
jgi:hypothetical protein